MRRTAVAALATLASLLIVTGPVASPPNAAPTPVAGNGNPWGVTVVRFVPGTSPGDMRAAVRAAGGTVANDLSEIGAMAVVPTSSSFASQLRANRTVTGLWV